MLLIDQRLNDGKNVLICIRDVEPNEKQPWTPQEVLVNLSNELEDLIQEGRIKIIIIPDIESINYGRGVGYVFEEETFEDSINDISATKIRKKMREEGDLT